MTVCEAREAECVCIRETRHKIHRCDCGGAWTYDEDGTMKVRAFPGGETDVFRMFSPFAGLFR